MSAPIVQSVPAAKHADKTATSAERFVQTIDFIPQSKPWVRWGSFLWEETIDVWRTQGYDGTPLDDLFELDRLIRVDPWYGLAPAFRHQAIAEDAATVTYVNSEGIVMREFKEHRGASMPQFIRFPVVDEADFDRIAGEHLQANIAERFSAEWQKKIAVGDEASATERWPRLCFAARWGGFFGALRNLMGVEGLSYAFYDQPALVRKMMAERADAILAITDEVLKRTKVDVFWFWEDMAYNHGPLVDPRLFRMLALPHYRRVCEELRKRGIRHIGLDCDGNIHELIPLWIEAGVNMLWPFEVQSGMDVVKIRKQYGRDLAMMGGLDKKEIAKGGDAMRIEVDRVMPLVEEGGYIPELDHGVPPDISFDVFCDYIGYIKKRMKRG